VADGTSLEDHLRTAGDVLLTLLSLAGLICLIGLPIYLIFLMATCEGPEPDPNGEAKSEIASDCREAVRKHLRAPGTARFPSGLSGKVTVRSTTADLYSYVDAENAFGGEVRTNFICTAERVGEDSWIVTARFRE